LVQNFKTSIVTIESAAISHTLVIPTPTTKTFLRCDVIMILHKVNDSGCPNGQFLLYKVFCRDSKHQE